MPGADVIHGLRFFVTVQCTNTVEMDTLTSSDERELLLRPPSITGSVLDMVTQNQYRTYPEDRVQSTMDSLKMQWTWPDSHTVEPLLYQCRLEGLGVMQWINTSVKFCEFPSLRMKDGVRYTGHVRAIDGRQRSSDEITASVTADSTTPRLSGSYK